MTITFDLWDPVYPEVPIPVGVRARPKVLLYVQDSWGLGHVRLVSKLARVLQTRADCLVICGHRESGWIIPDECEWFRIPSLNDILYERANFLGKTSFMSLSRKEGITFRQRLILEIINTFEPNIIIVEQSPLGMLDELECVLRTYSGIKIFLTRGILANPSRVRRFILKSNTEKALETSFDTLVVAADRRVWDLAYEYDLPTEIASKLTYVGYMSEEVDSSDITRVRAERGLEKNDKWIVCSAGGGALGETLIATLTQIMRSFPSVLVDVVQGPRSGLRWPGLPASVINEGNVRLHRECRTLPLFHAAADLVVCTGAYNSLVEVMEGGAPIIAFPVQLEPQDEQYLHSSRLSSYYPITVVSRMDELTSSISEAIESRVEKLSIRNTGRLEFGGLLCAQKLILSKLSASAP
jgi:predicted glycosyltransferase